MIKLLIRIFRLLLKKDEKSLIYYSFPDVSDNSFGLFCYVINNYPEFKNIWLINNVQHKKEYLQLISNYTESTHFLILKKKSLLGIYHFCKSKYIFHTHGIFNKLPLSKQQVNINLWHGMPLKNIGFLDGNANTQKSNYTIATSIFFKEIMGKAFQLKNKKVLVTGQPRNDFLFTKKYSLSDIVNVSSNNLKKTILWMPTYRKSKIGEIRNDGETNKMDDFLASDFLKKLNNYLIKIEGVCYIKLHPMDYMSVTDFQKHSNLYFIDNSDFQKKGISLYSILNSTDILLTDFSSIYIDYLLLNKPIGFLFSDFDAYFNSRGFVFETPKEYMPGEFITNKEDLIPFLERIFTDKKDLFKEQRNKINNLFNDQKSNFSKKVFESILEKEI